MGSPVPPDIDRLPPGADPHCERNPTPPRTARFRPGPAGLPAGSQPYWRPPGAQQGPTPHPQRAESRPVQPRFTPPGLRSRRVSSCSGHLREHNWDGRRSSPTCLRHSHHHLRQIASLVKCPAQAPAERGLLFLLFPIPSLQDSGILMHKR